MPAEAIAGCDACIANHQLDFPAALAFSYAHLHTKVPPMFQWNPQDYARNSSCQESLAKDLVALANVTADDVVLDVGCADGRTTAAIAAAATNGRVTGVDLSNEMIQHARDRYYASQPNLTFRQADAAHLPFENLFSLVFSNATLHWVPDQRAAVLGIARALISGGRLVAQFGGSPGNGTEVAEAFDEVAAAPRWRGLLRPFIKAYYFHEPRDYAEWLTQAGLMIEECRLIPKVIQYPGEEAFSGWLRTAWHPYTSRAEGELREAFIEETVARYLATHPRDESGAIRVHMARLQVRARKP